MSQNQTSKSGGYNYGNNLTNLLANGDYCLSDLSDILSENLNVL